MVSAVVQGKSPRDVPVAPYVCGQCQAYVVGAHDCKPVEVVPTSVAVLPTQLMMAPLSVGLGTRQDVERELDAIALAMRSFPLKQPDQVMREVAAYSARLTELCVLLHRVESQDRQYTRVRTQQVERFLAECDRQFKVASRIVEVQRQDLELLK